MIAIGSVVVFPDVPRNSYLRDVTLGKEYYITGIDAYGDPYFVDDIGENDFAIGPCSVYEVINKVQYVN